VTSVAARQTTNGEKLTVMGLGALVAALAYLNWAFLETGVDVSPFAAPSAPAQSRTARTIDLSTPIGQSRVESFAETVNRPLFNRDRRPVVRRTAAAEPAPDSTDLRLVGVLRRNGEPSRALIRFANEPAGKWIAEGEEVNGWTLRNVSERSVVVETAGRTHELQLNLPQRRSSGDDPGPPDQFEAKPQR